MQLHHLAFRTRDLPRLKAFYSGLLGLRTVRETPAKDGANLTSVWLSLNGPVLMLEIASLDEALAAPHTHELFALEVTTAEREALVERLVTAGVTIEARTEYTAYFRDPDGRRVGLSSYPLSAHRS